jgi:hypothetical protein
MSGTESENRANFGIISDFIFHQKTAAEQRAFRCYFRRSNSRKPRISAALDVPLAVNSWKNSEKQRELTRNLSSFLHRADLSSATDDESASFTQSCGVCSSFPRKRKAVQGTERCCDVLSETNRKSSCARSSLRVTTFGRGR